MSNTSGAAVDEDAVAEIMAIRTDNLADGYDSEPEVYREQVHDVVGALIGRCFDPAALLKAMRR